MENGQVREQVKQKLKQLPMGAGVYFHKNQAGEIIYVGKAAVLRNRVRQYFQKTEKDPKTQALVEEIFDVEWREVETEMDALFLESEMIKRYQPKWNILLRDDKNVTYVKVNFQLEVPYVEFTRVPLDDGAVYVGPFYGGAAIKKAMRCLRKIFPYYDKPYNGKKSLYTDLKLTPRIEIGEGNLTSYKRSLRRLVLFLEKGRKNLTLKMEKEMKRAAAREDFELAAELKNQLYQMREIQKKIIFSDREFVDLSKDQALMELAVLAGSKKPPRRIEGYDISHHGGENAVASMVVFTNGVSERTAYRKFKIKQSKNNDFANMREVLERRLKHQEWPLPDLFLIDGGAPQLRAVKEVLEPLNIPYLGLSERFEMIVKPTPEGYREIALPMDSHTLKLLQRIRDEAHRFAISYHTYLKRKSMLKS